MDIFAEIAGVEYSIHNNSSLQEVKLKDFDINNIRPSCLIKNKGLNVAISKWVSPKRTRSYPFERVYNTLTTPRRMTVIPVIKDEGARGDRDFIQWDTVSLMSLLNVYVILAYYRDADKHPTRENKITNQRFDNGYVRGKIEEISSYHSSALHWNLKEIKETLPPLIDEAKKLYSEMEKRLVVRFHSSSGIERFQSQFIKSVDEFMTTSREKAKDAQNREQHTIQPKEALSTRTKARITIKNYLGGVYYLVPDEARIENERLLLIEDKHSRNAKLPSLADIRDGLLKMILYCNLSNVRINDSSYEVTPVLRLTSSDLQGGLTSHDGEGCVADFFDRNSFNEKHRKSVNTLFRESRENSFTLIIEKA